MPRTTRNSASTWFHCSASTQDPSLLIYKTYTEEFDGELFDLFEEISMEVSSWASSNFLSREERHINLAYTFDLESVKVGGAPKVKQSGSHVVFMAPMVFVPANAELYKMF